ncbi:MAG: hypothetical protein ABI675_12490 [Chitinophagaceae bacterium]
MMRTMFFLCLATISTTMLQAQDKKKTKWLKGMYFQWGYNTEAYTRSNIHFKMSNGDNFILHKAKAHDSRDYDAILEKPLEVSIPQYNYRLGFYLNKQHTRAIEANFDHAKYIVTDGQKVRVTGIINGKAVDGDSILDRYNFLHFEHTDGANWLHINYVQQKGLAKNKAKTRDLLTYVWKAGAGINIPRSDFTWKGDRLNNHFHIAGYNISTEAGVRFYMLKKIFFETTGKTGYVKYLNALANTTTVKGNRARQSFAYIEAIATLGFDIGF